MSSFEPQATSSSSQSHSQCQSETVSRSRSTSLPTNSVFQTFVAEGCVVHHVRATSPLPRACSVVTWASAPRKKSNLKSSGKSLSTAAESKPVVMFACPEVVGGESSAGGRGQERKGEGPGRETEEGRRGGKPRRCLGSIGKSYSLPESAEKGKTINSMGKSHSLVGRGCHGNIVARDNDDRGVVAPLPLSEGKKVTSLSDLSSHPKAEPEWYKLDLDSDLSLCSSDSSHSLQEATPTATAVVIETKGTSCNNQPAPPTSNRPVTSLQTAKVKEEIRTLRNYSSYHVPDKVNKQPAVPAIPIRVHSTEAPVCSIEAPTCSIVEPLVSQLPPPWNSKMADRQRAPSPSPSAGSEANLDSYPPSHYEFQATPTGSAHPGGVALVLGRDVRQDNITAVVGCCRRSTLPHLSSLPSSPSSPFPPSPLSLPSPFTPLSSATPPLYSSKEAPPTTLRDQRAFPTTHDKNIRRGSLGSSVNPRGQSPRTGTRMSLSHPYRGEEGRARSQTAYLPYRGESPPCKGKSLISPPYRGEPLMPPPLYRGEPLMPPPLYRGEPLMPPPLYRGGKEKVCSRGRARTASLISPQYRGEPPLMAPPTYREGMGKVRPVNDGISRARTASLISPYAISMINSPCLEPVSAERVAPGQVPFRSGLHRSMGRYDLLQSPSQGPVPNLHDPDSTDSFQIQELDLDRNDALVGSNHASSGNLDPPGAQYFNFPPGYSEGKGVKHSVSCCRGHQHHSGLSVSRRSLSNSSHSLTGSVGGVQSSEVGGGRSPVDGHSDVWTPDVRGSAGNSNPRDSAQYHHRPSSTSSREGTLLFLLQYLGKAANYSGLPHAPFALGLVTTFQGSRLERVHCLVCVTFHGMDTFKYF